MKELVEELATFVAKFLFGVVLVPMVVIVLMALISSNIEGDSVAKNELRHPSVEKTAPRPDWCERPNIWFEGKCNFELPRQTPEEFTFIDPFEDSPPPAGFEYRSPFSRSDDAEDSKGDG